MNHKIKELAGKALDKAMPYTWSTLDYEQIHELLACHAELIVQECISCVGSQGDKVYLKKHFGLPVESDIVYPAVEESWSVETQYTRKYNLAPDRDMGGI